MGLIVYFHGLESKIGGPKYKFLKDRYGDVYAPQLDYRQANLFNTLYEQLKNQKVDIIAGSSMGGYFAYWMGKKLNAKTAILFNPALPYRTSLDPAVDKSGKGKMKIRLILSEDDSVINPLETQDWLKAQGEHFSVDWDKINPSHRTSIPTFKKAFKKYG